MSSRQIRLSAALVGAVSVILASGFLWLIVAALDSRFALDTDVINLALSINEFDLQAHQPHPPGYLGYVLLLKGVHAMVGMEPLETTKFVCRIMAVLAMVFTYKATRVLRPSHVASAQWALALAASSPMLLYYALDGQTHAAECAAAALFVWRLSIVYVSTRNSDTISIQMSIGMGLTLALGAAFRPSFALLVVLPVLHIFWGHWRALIVTVIVGALGTALWLVPTVVLAGGFDAYRDMSDALIGMFARKTSVFSPVRDFRMVLDNVYGVLLWAGIVGFAVPAALFIGRRSSARDTASGMGWRMAVPSLLFYTLVFIAEPGYLLGLVPPACIVTALALADSESRLRQWLLGALVLVQLVFFFGAPTLPNSALLWTPTVSEIVYRQSMADAVLQNISDGVDAQEQILVVADLGPTFVYRQLPLLRRGTDVLLIHSERLVVYEQTTLSLISEDGWRAAPGPQLLAEGPPSQMRSTRRYDRIIVGPIYSPQLRDELAAQSPCIEKEQGIEPTTLRLPVSTCFPQFQLQIAPHQLRWNADRNDVVAR